MQKKSLSRYWLIIGVVALAIAGLYSMVLAGGRSPKIGESQLLGRLFHEALVVHVDLSVLVWFLSIACLLWSLMTEKAKLWLPYIEETALICFLLGTIAITVSPFDPSGEALMSNYIPVIHSPIFFIGLMLVFCGTGLMVIKALCGKTSGYFSAPLEYALQVAAIITAMALASFYWSFHQLPSVIDGQQYYDMLFWGGGHVLQFTHVQVAIVCWFLMVKLIKPEFSLYPRHFTILISVGLLGAFVAPFIYLLTDITSSAHRNGFTYLMILLNGIAPTIFVLLVLPALWKFRSLRKGDKRAIWIALVMSMLLFTYGNILGAFIQGENVVIPAHYHGTVVGLTLAFMGAAYMFLPKLGYGDVSATRLAYWQPYVYGVGQFMHVSGFAWSGGYGALRKTPGGSYEGWQQVAMGLMGGGAGLAAIGGLMFVVVIARAVLKKKIA